MPRQVIDTNVDNVTRLVKCHCGRTHKLEKENWAGDSKCECGQWYNAFGQKLNPPSQWGEETGERFDEDGGYIGGGEDD